MKQSLSNTNSIVRHRALVNDQHGMTLIELIVVLGILAGLASLAVESYVG